MPFWKVEYFEKLVALPNALVRAAKTLSWNLLIYYLKWSLLLMFKCLPISFCRKLKPKCLPTPMLRDNASGSRTSRSSIAETWLTTVLTLGTSIVVALNTLFFLRHDINIYCWIPRCQSITCVRLCSCAICLRESLVLLYIPHQSKPANPLHFSEELNSFFFGVFLMNFFCLCSGLTDKVYIIGAFAFKFLNKFG